IAFSSAARTSRFSGVSCLLSRTPLSTRPHRRTVSASSTAQAATTGPAQAPRPASSTPPQATPGGTLPRSQSSGFTGSPGEERELPPAGGLVAEIQNRACPCAQGTANPADLICDTLGTFKTSKRRCPAP